MAEPVQVVVVDKAGEQGVVQGYNPNDRLFIVDYQGREIAVPADLLVVQEGGGHALPMRFADLVPADRSDHPTGPIVLPVVEEEVHVEKRPVELGTVRVHKTVQERQEIIDEPLVEDRIEVERVPVNQLLSEPVTTRLEGDTMIVPVMREVLVVQKQLLLVEEVRITKTRAEVHRPQEVTLRSEEVHVERVDASGGSAQGD